MSPAELTSIRARVAAATPGPWRLSDGGWGEYVQDADGHARADVPALLAELARLELEATALRRALELLTACACEVDGGLDCPNCEPVPPMVRRALERGGAR